MNFFNHQRKINKDWYEGTTNIYPIDVLIKKVTKYAYLHHIERLMYIGNWSMISKIHPKEIYKWFMITCIDAYEWVMITNVHGMSQHALDNSVISMMTRPYFSSTNYIKNMSDLNEGKEWQTVWNAVYYNFIYENIDYLKHNYSVARQVRHWNNKTSKEKDELIKIAKKYLY
jgi:deoxyribodipyrimidine photolyase-related protein